MKKPRWKESPTVDKSPRYPKEDITGDDLPSWRVGTLDKDGPWGWSNIDANTLWNLIHIKIAAFEKMTWNEILKDKKRNHYIKLVDLCSAAQKRLTQIKQDDVEELLSLHLRGRERIFGIRAKNILKIIWWDPDHQVYPSIKKHT